MKRDVLRGQTKRQKNHGSVIVTQASTEDEFHAPSKEELATYRGTLKYYFDEDVDIENREERIAKQKKIFAKKVKKYNPNKWWI